MRAEAEIHTQMLGEGFKGSEREEMRNESRKKKEGKKSTEVCRGDRWNRLESCFSDDVSALHQNTSSESESREAAVSADGEL